MKRKQKRKACKSLQLKLNMVTFLGTWQTHNSPGTAVQHNYLQIKGVCLSVCRSVDQKADLLPDQSLKGKNINGGQKIKIRSY